MKILVLSDLHSNIWALQSILQREGNLDLLCCAGDFVDYGTTPSEILDCLTKYQDISMFVKGNHDMLAVSIYQQYLKNNITPNPYKWIHHNCQRLSSSQIQYLDSLPVTLSFLADGYAYIIKHQYDNAYGTILNSTQFMEFWAIYATKELLNFPNKRIIFGHTHRQGVHYIDNDSLWLNPGSTSYRRPNDPDKSAQYIVIENGNISMNHVSYNRTHLLAEALRYKSSGSMLSSEIEDFEFFFGEKNSTR